MANKRDTWGKKHNEKSKENFINLENDKPGRFHSCRCKTMLAIVTLHCDFNAVNEDGGSSTSWFSALICRVFSSAERDLRARTGGLMFRTGGCSEVDRDNPGN